MLFRPSAERLNVVVKWFFLLIRKARLKLISQKTLFIVFVFAILFAILTVYGLSKDVFRNAYLYIEFQKLGRTDFNLLTGIVVRCFPLALYVASTKLSSLSTACSLRKGASVWFSVCLLGLVFYVPLSLFSSELAVRLTAYLTQFDAVLLAYCVVLVSKTLSRLLILASIFSFSALQLFRYVDIPAYTYSSLLF